ncbi:RIP metalloprotease RseP [Dyella caseinilytica]|uniref:Zinc metalloprotease n=1 Tax=Dyella caseinilytica TaxID=1849581 RepID=A0ABX7GRQ3_9GAMM|nr:RIP metalloprotease RseP [Dyella caseinilytica]QRN52599.1 RIP metalloprotease RseP [Dyella caseinilytica]GGA07307.1 zinc metalloprotease [Dyella caseinilytica]
MNPFFGSVFWLLVTLGVLVTFHEFGHYWVARRCGVKVLRFSVGFGRAIWKRIGRDGTEYQIAAIPLGGYVKMLDAREGDVDPALRDQEFTAQPIWKRIAIVAAGPGFNIIFTIAAFWLMFVLGRADYAPIVSAAPQSLAAQAGIQPGDRLLTVGGEPVMTWSGSADLIANALLSRTPLPITVRGSDGTQRSIVLPLNRLPAGEDIGQYFDKLGIEPAPAPAIVATVAPGYPAATAGMQAGDHVLSVDGIAVKNFDDLSKQIVANAAKSPTLSLDVLRNGKPMHFAVTARMDASGSGAPHWVIGVAQQPLETAIQHYGPLKALTESLSLTWQRTTDTFGMVGKMLSGEASTKNISGIVGIAQAANMSAHAGLDRFLEFLGLVSLSLAIINLLPIPILDGGHLLYYLIELIKGSPVSERTMIAGQYVGLALLVTLTVLTFYNDIHRIILPS